MRCIMGSWKQSIQQSCKIFCEQVSKRELGIIPLAFEWGIYKQFFLKFMWMTISVIWEPFSSTIFFAWKRVWSWEGWKSKEKENFIEFSPTLNEEKIARLIVRYENFILFQYFGRHGLPSSGSYFFFPYLTRLFWLSFHHLLIGVAGWKWGENSFFM